MNNDQLVVLIMGCLLIVCFVVCIIGLLITDWWAERSRAKRRCADSLVTGASTSVMVAVMPNIEEGDVVTIGGREVTVLSVSRDGTTLTMIVGDVE